MKKFISDRKYVFRTVPESTWNVVASTCKHLSFVYTYCQCRRFVSGTFDLLDVMCKLDHKTASNQFLNGTKNGDVDGLCERSPIAGFQAMRYWYKIPSTY